MTKQKNITPTLTLANIYEAQKQFLDAYAIYHKLYAINQSDEIKERMLSAEQKFYAEETVAFDPLINQIFSTQDKILFRILPAESYTSFHIALDKNDIEITEFAEEEIPESEDEPTSESETIEDAYIPEIEPLPIDDETTEELFESETLPELDTPTEILDEIQITAKTAKKRQTKQKGAMDISLIDLANYIKKNYKKEKKISDLTIKDILKIFADLS